MDYRQTTLERAFDLARSGDCRSVEYLTKKLKSEGYDLVQMQGKSLRKQLSDLIESNDMH
ncbi:MAG TPA: hypothetical protein VM144_04385 [Aestuariivirga sp.]|nr:hypothetical protein [Aestuariivirga sp.]